MLRHYKETWTECKTIVLSTFVGSDLKGLRSLTNLLSSLQRYIDNMQVRYLQVHNNFIQQSTIRVGLLLRAYFAGIHFLYNTMSQNNQAVNIQQKYQFEQDNGCSYTNVLQHRAQHPIIPPVPVLLFQSHYHLFHYSMLSPPGFRGVTSQSGCS